MTTFGEFQDVKRKGRTPIAAKSKTESPKKKVANLKHEDEDEEESEESDAINNEDEIEEDKERDKKKAKSEKSALKDYLGEKSFKSSPGKSEKYHSQIKAAQQILTRKPTPLKASPEETKKETVENKLKLDSSDKKTEMYNDRLQTLHRIRGDVYEFFSSNYSSGDEGVAGYKGGEWVVV